MDSRAQIERILDKLKRVRKVAFKATKLSFGSEKHTFHLAGRVSTKAIRVFENRHGIHLPEDYRQFPRKKSPMLADAVRQRKQDADAKAQIQRCCMARV